MEDLFEAIRENASKDAWSRGVELARQDAVTGDRSSDEEIVLRVLDRKTGVSAVVTLLPIDLDWNRDCGCKVDPCPHVTAAVIALKRAQEQGQELPKSKAAAGTIVHAFTRDQGGLHFERVISLDGQLQLLTVPLTSISTGRVTNLPVTPTKVDLAVESALQGDRRGRLQAGTLARILPLLVEAEVTLDSQPCAVIREPLGLVIVVRDEGIGIHVQGKKDARIKETFSNGAVLAEDGLHPQGELQLDPEERQMLAQGFVVPLRDLEKFSSETLPKWERRFKVENTARNMPKFVHAEARLDLYLETRGSELWLQPGIVYGDPPIAVIRDGVFRPTGSEVPIRDPDSERKLKDDLWRQWGMELYHGRLYAAPEAIRMVEHFKKWDGSISGDGLRQFRKVGRLKADVAWKDGRLHLDMELEGQPGTSPIDGTMALKAWERGDSLVPLLDGGFAELPRDWFARFGKQVLDLLLAQEEKNQLPKAALPQVIQLFDEQNKASPPDLQAFRRLRHFDFHNADVRLPTNFQADLRAYQKQGVAWLQHLQNLELGALLADDMGLGKTVQAIATLASSGNLIIAPTSVLPNWKRELQRFRPNLRVALYHGPQRQWDPKADVVLTSYGLVRTEEERFATPLWNTLVLDEAQTIKNPESRIAQAVQKLKGKFRLALSGTPVENRLDDLWSLFAFVNPGLLGGRKDFRERFSRPIEDGQEVVAERLRHIIRPFILRRLKRDVAPELPPRIEKVLYAELWPEERQLYTAIQTATRKDVVEKLQAGGSVIEALEALLRMRQACCHPSLLPHQEAAHSSKLTVLIDNLETALSEGHKALVFSQWTSLLDLLEPILQTAGMRYLRLDGSTNDRQAVVDAFQSVDGPPILIMSLKAGGVGLNLTQADHVFILDPWWNPAAQDQAADRAHRIGQDRTVMIHPIVALDSVEEKILELQAVKRALAAAAVGEGAVIPSLTRDDLLHLLA
ncbi:MAG TPA: DEAD/DEAH box helicase [Oligoflexus sp.]|uniref:DEAD/DEAH box helicase n=1 Tax=Oligoflexus sp. TaxID=1971216 RepID=UPI002D68AFDE|nr:DEAD/DEAH box helicase [Oligoflexus sp.]HYX34475.1 DEAD/DEAH box helicase [Oligoflexus sp.]